SGQREAATEVDCAGPEHSGAGVCRSRDGDAARGSGRLWQAVLHLCRSGQGGARGRAIWCTEHQQPREHHWNPKRREARRFFHLEPHGHRNPMHLRHTDIHGLLLRLIDLDLLRGRSAGKLRGGNRQRSLQYTGALSGASHLRDTHEPGSYAGRAAMRPRLVSDRKRPYWRGQTAVEFALAASLLFMLMFAIIKFGLVVYSYNTVAHTTRECVRYAFVHGPGSQNPQTASAIQQHF